MNKKAKSINKPKRTRPLFTTTVSAAFISKVKKLAFADNTSTGRFLENLVEAEILRRKGAVND